MKPQFWTLQSFSDGSMAIVAEDGTVVTPVRPRSGVDHDIPNFRLMAAGPDLLAAAKEMLEAWEEQFGEGACDCRPEPENQGHVCQCCKTRHAIEKAEVGR